MVITIIKAILKSFWAKWQILNEIILEIDFEDTDLQAQTNALLSNGRSSLTRILDSSLPQWMLVNGTRLGSKSLPQTKFFPRHGDMSVVPAREGQFEVRSPSWFKVYHINLTANGTLEAHNLRKLHPPSCPPASIHEHTPYNNPERS